MVLIAIASVIWVPVGVLIGLRPALAEQDPAARAVPRGVPGEPAVPGVCRGDREVPPEPGYLALAADRARHAVVYPFQRDCRGDVVSERLSRGGHQFPDQGLAVVAPGHPAGHLPVLRHRRDHGVGRGVEREHRGRSGVVGPYENRGARTGRVYRGNHGRWRLSENHSRHCRDVAVRHALQPALVATVVRATPKRACGWIEIRCESAGTCRTAAKSMHARPPAATPFL